MKYILIFFLATTVFGRAAAQEHTTEIYDTIVSADKIQKQLKANKAVLIDVRTPEEFASGHLKYARNINFKSESFKSEVSKLDRKKQVYLYCRSGNRSGKAADTLRTLGFVAPLNIGGFAYLTSRGLQAAEK